MSPCSAIPSQSHYAMLRGHRASATLMLATVTLVASLPPLPHCAGPASAEAETPSQLITPTSEQRRATLTQHPVIPTGLVGSHKSLDFYYSFNLPKQTRRWGMFAQSSPGTPSCPLPPLGICPHPGQGAAKPTGDFGVSPSLVITSPPLAASHSNPRDATLLPAATHPFSPQITFPLGIWKSSLAFGANRVVSPPLTLYRH